MPITVFFVDADKVQCVLMFKAKQNTQNYVNNAYLIIEKQLPKLE